MAPDRKTVEQEKEIWIDPTGGLGDALMLSGVLKQCMEQRPGFRYNLVRRSIYRCILAGHPAIARTGYPSDGDEVITTDYWAKEKLGKGEQRAYQILARMFGLQTPAVESLYLPGKVPEDALLHKLLPDAGRRIVVIAPASVSPRKMIPLQKWKELVRLFKENDYFVVQVGRWNDMYVPGAFSLLGQTNPHQLIGILEKCSLLVGIDNFIMHAAHLTGIRALIVWGPTNPEVYGYPSHTHIEAPTADCHLKDRCLGTDTPDNYSTLCPLGEQHCMNRVPVQMLLNRSVEILTTANEPT